MDKEKLAKHHFWILWILALVLLPVVMGMVWMSIASATEKRREEITKRLKEEEGAKPKGENFVKAMEAEKQILESRKFKDWNDAYAKQKGLIEWPATLAHLNQKYFGDSISDEDRNTLRKSEVYIPEFEALADLIKPTELTGGWQQVLRPVKWSNRPTDEDAWLALEDLCIQREMLRCVHDVNQLLAQLRDATNDFKEIDNKKDYYVLNELKESLKPVEGETVQRFVSPYWQLDFAISKAPQGKGGEFAIRGKLKNVSHRRLHVARIDFLLTMNDPKVQQSRPAVLTIESDYIKVADATSDNAISFNKTISATAPKALVYTVEQKLDPRFVPVKRLDKVVLGYHSHRTVDKPLVLCKMSEEAKKATPNPEPPPPDTNAPPAPGATGSQTVDKSISGIDRQRYVTCTDQVRRMPIGVVVTVDQAHVQDVLRAFANSRLRFQTTQMHLTHATMHGGTGSGGNVPAGPIPAPPPPRSGGEQRPGERPVPGGNLQPPALVTAPGAASGGTEESNANLVEMAIYGIASIYEKYPPKSATTPNAKDTPK